MEKGEKEEGEREREERERREREKGIEMMIWSNMEIVNGVP